MPILALLTLIGLVFRIVVAGDSVFSDELSTYWIVSENGLRGVLTTVHGNGEITPPLYFVLAWLTTRVDLSPEWLRAPSLLAGVATIPMTYLLGSWTVARRTGLTAAALVALSPFMILYSAEARGYAVAIALVMGSTLALLAATERRQTRWWVLYAACTCAAVYTHYTAVFALGAQLLWLLWAHPEARRPALLANAAAALGFLPWLSGLANDLDSPTTKILSQLEPFDLDNVRTSLEHWSIGYPYSLVPLSSLPGTVGLLLLAGALVVAGVGIALRRPRPSLARLDRRVVLIVTLLLATPVGEAIASAVGTNVFGTRNLAIAWPPLAIGLAALLEASGGLRVAAVTLAIAGFAIGAVKMLDPDRRRPDYEAAAAFIDREAGPGDVVIDATGVSPAPFSAVDVTLERPHRLLYLRTSGVQYRPFRFLPAPSPAQVADRAAVAARGHRIFVVTGPILGRLVMDRLPPTARRVETRRFPGFLDLRVVTYHDGRQS